MVLRMARPREFDPVKVTDLALQVFWRNGYEGASIEDLVKHTGLKRQGLYNVFGDKEGLFVATLARYRELLALDIAALRQESATMKQLRAYLVHVLDMQRTNDVGACLLVQTAFTPHIEDPRIRSAVEKGASYVRATFAAVIARAVKRGEVPKHTVPAEGAAYLYSVLNGLSALSRTGGKKKEITAALDRAFSTFVTPLPPRRTL